MTEPLKDWQIPTTCKFCNDTIYSKYSGEFVECSCGKLFVDQTPYYGRYGGEGFKVKDEHSE